MSAPANESGTYGFLALMQLNASAQTDGRLTGSDRRLLGVMIAYAGIDGSCCVSLRRIAERLGVTRQMVQKCARAIEAAGYFTSRQRHRANGAEGSKVFKFNLELAGAKASPLPRVAVVNVGDDSAEGGQLPEVARPGNPQRLPPRQPPEVAHKKPVEETTIEETNASSLREPPPQRAGNRDRQRPSGNGVRQQGGTWRQPSLLMPIAGGGGESPLSASVQDRVNAHNLDRQRDVAGRMSREWSELDPGLQLLDCIGDGKQRLWERARDFEVQRHGSGLWYIAHAIERASGGRYTADAIMAGAHARSRANGEAG